MNDGITAFEGGRAVNRRRTGGRFFFHLGGNDDEDGSSALRSLGGLMVFQVYGGVMAAS